MPSTALTVDVCKFAPGSVQKCHLRSMYHLIRNLPFGSSIGEITITQKNSEVKQHLFGSERKNPGVQMHPRAISVGSWWRRRALPPASERAPDKTSTSVSVHLMSQRSSPNGRLRPQPAPKFILASQVRDSLGRNSPLNDATTPSHGADRSEERSAA